MKSKVPEEKARIPEEKKSSEYLANERTFLAWIRTSIAIISLGFVVAKFGVWLRELASHLAPQAPVHSTGLSLPIGVTMMALGGVIAVLAAWHYHLVNRAIEHGEVQANRTLIVTVTAGISLLALAMIVYLLVAADRL